MCDNKMTIQFPKNYATGRNQREYEKISVNKILL